MKYLSYLFGYGSSPDNDTGIEENLDERLLSACLNGDWGNAEDLVNGGADFTAKDKHGWTSVAYACADGQESFINLLFEKKINIQEIISQNISSNNESFSPLYFACQYQHTEVVRLILDRGNLLLDSEADQNVYLNVVIQQSNPSQELQELLLTEYLCTACEMNRLEEVQHLIKQGAKVNKPNIRGMTPLLKASYQGHDEVVMLLIAQCADIKQTHPNGISPLFVAAEQGHLSTVTYLLEQKANPNLADNIGWTPFSVAVNLNRTDIAALILKNGGDINYQRVGNDPQSGILFGDTILHSMMRAGNNEMVQWLLKQENCLCLLENSKGELPKDIQNDKISEETREQINDKTANQIKELHSAFNAECGAMVFQRIGTTEKTADNPLTANHALPAELGNLIGSFIHKENLALLSGTPEGDQWLDRHLRLEYKIPEDRLSDVKKAIHEDLLPGGEQKFRDKVENRGTRSSLSLG